MARRALATALVIGMVTGGLPASTLGVRPGTRPPIQAERKALEDATYRSDVGDKGIDFVRVSAADPNFAIVGWNYAGAPSDWLVTSLFARVHDRWKLLYEISGHAPSHGRASADGACALAPAAIVSILYQYHCSFTFRQLHARPATHTETLKLQAALDTYFRGSDLGPRLLGRVCISRDAPNWAAADDGNGGFVWLKRTGASWQVDYVEGNSGTKPSHAIVLSLGSCVGYFASDYE